MNRTKFNRRRTWDHEVTLLILKDDEDDAGYPIEAGIEQENTVLANVLSVGRSEHFASQRNGIKTDEIFEIHTIEYSNEKKLKHEGKIYNIKRTYEVSEDFIELYCSDISAKGVV